MIYTYDCTHPDCGATVDKFRTIAERDLPAACPCSASHETKRREVYNPGIAVRGGTRNLGWAEKVNADYRATQVKRTMEETF